MAGSFSAVDGKTSGTKDSIKTIYDMAKSGPVIDSDGKKTFQFVQYFEGVGTKGISEGSLPSRASALFDAATGHGYLNILQNGCKVCCQQLQHEDPKRHEIFIFGFSRGAFISRALASFIQYVGLINAEFLDKDENDNVFQARFEELLQQYASITKRSYLVTKSTKERQYKLLPFCIPSPRVRLVGAFDTVKTVIPLPVTNYLSHGISSIDFEMDAPGIVDHFRHSLALNEARALFNPDLWKSDADSAESSYLEAWSFGYHHDIGDGEKVQGLALWPLQWILQAAKDYGLTLDPDVEPYNVLFIGEDNTIETPHDITMKMFDMIKHHTETRTWGLALHMPGSYLSPQPRNYFEYLTTPPYLKFLKPRVFLHPSAYLVFDVSSSFRLQLYQWKYVRNFLRDRFITLPKGTTPWWERQTVNGILKENTAVRHLNILVIGKPGTGKLELVGRMFGKVQETKHGINIPITIPGNDQVRIYYSDGFGEGGSDDRVQVEAFLDQHRNNPDVEEQIHAVWYFLDTSQKDIPESEKELFKMNFGQIPVLVVLSNEDKLQNQIREALINYDSSMETDILTEVNAAVEKVKDQCKRLPARTYVRAQSSVDTGKNLLTDTSMHLENESVYIAQIKAQRIELKPKVALATEESIRAYTIWHCFKFSGKKHSFSRNVNPDGMKLSMMLIEPVLSTFNVRFAEDAALIQSLIGHPWNAIDQYTSGLWDDSLPSELILTCTLDTIIVMTHALSHQHIGGRLKSFKDNAQPLSATDVKRACAWYTAPKANKQAETHGKIKELLSENGSPMDSCIANLQMKIIEIVELQSDSARNALSAAIEGLTSVVGSAAGGVTSAVGSAAGGIIHGATGVLGGVIGVKSKGFFR